MSDPVHYYISKGRKTVGPCTLDDLLSYVAYGSVQPDDLVRRDGDSDWSPLGELEELRALDDGTGTKRQDITKRRRVVRYREYERVPETFRSGVVLRRLIVGFLIYPPSLWKGAGAIFHDRIYGPRKDEGGFLLHWPQWVSSVAAALLVINTLAWCVALGWIFLEFEAVARFVMDLVRSASGK